MRILAAFCSGLFLASCSRDPASEAPVELRAGLYQVNIGGGTIVELKDGARGGEVCLDSYSASEFPNDPVQALAGSWDGCSAKIEPRKGNAISGARTCEQRAMPMTMNYSGSIAQDGFIIHGTVAQGSDESESRMHLGSGDFTISGKRAGGCTL
jgi:hypothetical protein